MSELELLEQFSKVKIAEKARTELNKANGCKVKGFSTNCHNYSRDSTVYSMAESIFKNKLLNSGFSKADFIHEFPVTVRDKKGQIHRYHLDFYFPKLKLAIEINPEFHYSYEPVVIRDKIRNLVLLRYGIRTLEIHVEIENYSQVHKNITSLNKADVKQVLKTLRALRHKPSIETLDYYNVSNRTKKNKVVPIGSNSLNIPLDTLESYKNVR